MGILVEPDQGECSLKRIATCTLLTTALLFAQPTCADLQGSLERIYEQQGIQMERSSDDFRGFERLLKWMATHGQAIGYTLLGLGVVAVLILLVVMLDSRAGVLFKNVRAGAQGGNDARISSGMPTESMNALLAHADGLASSGRCGEAIHALLVGLLDWLRRDPGLDWRPAQTAREIAAIQDASGRLGLWELVQTSERSFFGGYDAPLESYRACRESFSKFVSEVSTKAEVA